MNIGSTKKGRQAKKRIIGVAASVMRERGVTHTTLEAIKDAARVSSSQLFHYFPDGKAELLLEVFAFEIEGFFTSQQPWLAALHDWDAWNAWSEHMVACYSGRGPVCGFGRMATQVDTADPAIQGLLSDMQIRWEAAIASGIRTLQDAGRVSVRLDPSSCAAALVAGIQGGLMMMQATGSTRHLEAVFREMSERLKEHGQDDVVIRRMQRNAH